MAHLIADIITFVALGVAVIFMLDTARIVWLMRRDERREEKFKDEMRKLDLEYLRLKEES